MGCEEDSRDRFTFLVLTALMWDTKDRLCGLPSCLCICIALAQVFPILIRGDYTVLLSGLTSPSASQSDTIFLKVLASCCLSFHSEGWHSRLIVWDTCISCGNPGTGHGPRTRLRGSGFRLQASVWLSLGLWDVNQLMENKSVSLPARPPSLLNSVFQINK